MRKWVNGFVGLMVGDREGEPGILALITGALIIAAAVAGGMHVITYTFNTWRFFYHCAVTALIGLSVYSFRAPGRLFKNSIRTMLGKGALEKIVYFALCLGVVIDVTNLGGFPEGIGIALTFLVFGLAILGKGIVWYFINSRAHLQKTVVAFLIVSLVSYLIIAAIPLRSVYLERLSPSQYVELPRPGVDVVLGGDEVIVYAAGTNFATNGTTCFYAPGDLVVAFAHSLGGKPLANVARVQKGPSFDVTIVVDSKVGVVIKGIPQPENRPTLPLGGTADITIGGRAIVYPQGREPYEVTVQFIGRYDGPLHVVLKPDSRSEKVVPGDSGAPVVQNGVIIGFVNRYPILSDKFHAIVAAELYAEMKQYLNP